MSVRTAGRRGRLPAKTGSDKLAIGWVHSYLTQPLPAPVYPVDVSGGITDWLMLRQRTRPDLCRSIPNGVGDCTFAGRQHYRNGQGRSRTRAPMPTGDQRRARRRIPRLRPRAGRRRRHRRPPPAWYQAGQDPRRSHPWITPTRPRWTRPWPPSTAPTAASTSPTTQTNCSRKASPGPSPAGSGPTRTTGTASSRSGRHRRSGADTWVTWGALQKSTPEWATACLREAWVIITAEDAKAASLDIAKLRADIDALHGTGGAPAPAPAPVPVASFLAELADEVDAIASKVRTFLAGLWERNTGTLTSYFPGAGAPWARDSRDRPHWCPSAPVAAVFCMPWGQASVRVFRSAAVNASSTSAGMRPFCPHLVAVVPCPHADPDGTLPGLPRTPRRLLPHRPGHLGIRRHRLAERLSVLAFQVDLILGAVQAEPDSLRTR